MKVTTRRGKVINLPAILEPLATILRKHSALIRAERLAREVEGEALSPLFKRLKAAKDVDGLLEVASTLTNLGSSNGRFFYEAAEKLK